MAEPVTVPTFTGLHEYVPFNLRPYPEQVEEKLGKLAARLVLLQQEVAALRVQVALLTPAPGVQRGDQ